MSSVTRGQSFNGQQTTDHLLAHIGPGISSIRKESRKPSPLPNITIGAIDPGFAKVEDAADARRPIRQAQGEAVVVYADPLTTQ
jgi:hypothetical protein